MIMFGPNPFTVAQEIKKHRLLQITHKQDFTLIQPRAISAKARSLWL